MRKIINLIKKIIVFIEKKLFIVYDSLKSNSYNKLVAIVSCDKWKNKSLEDLYLKHSLNKQNCKVDIISWEDKTIDYSKYDLIIIRSIWGFQENKTKFENWLNMLETQKIKVLNPINVIKNNYDKEIQFDILNKYNIETIKTFFLPINKNIKSRILDLKTNNDLENNLIVLKPTISEGSKDVYLVGDNRYEFNNIIDINEVYNKYKNNKSKLMVQPFMKEIFDGEYSICCINNKITHGIIKYKNAFTKTNMIKYIPADKIDHKIIEIVNNILNIKEYKDNLFLRIDFVKQKKKFLVMEVELLDPNLFLEFIADRKKRKEILNFFAEQIIEYTKNKS